MRRLAYSDLDLLLRAQAACPQQLDALGGNELGLLLKRGMIDGLVLEAQDCRALLCWQRDGEHALITCLYREGDSPLSLADGLAMLNRAEGVLREFGVVRLYLGVATNTDNFATLVKLYGRVGFDFDMVRMSKGI